MPLCSRFFHILFVDSDNDKFVTGVEVRPSKHRRQLQPLRCVCGAPGPTHRICAYISRAALLHASHTQAIHPCTPLAPPRIILTASHLRRARTSPSRREGCGVCQAPPSSPRRPTTPWPQVTILDFLETFTTSSRRWPHQFLFYLPFLPSDFRRAVCVMARTGVASRAAVRGVHFFASIVMSV